jgi:hypothetical protein
MVRKIMELRVRNTVHFSVDIYKVGHFSVDIYKVGHFSVDIYKVGHFFLKIHEHIHEGRNQKLIVSEFSVFNILKFLP